MSSQLRNALSKLVLLLPKHSLEQETSDPEFLELLRAIGVVLDGQSSELISSCETLTGQEATSILLQYPAKSLRSVLGEFVDFVVQKLPPVTSQLLAISALQLFIQGNFTGPQCSLSTKQMWFPHAEASALQYDSVKLLNIEGKTAYDLMNEPLLLAFSLLIFESLLNLPHTLVQWSSSSSIEQITSQEVESFTALDVANSPINASLVWWRARALQTHISVISEPSDILASATSALLQQEVVNSLVPAGESDLELQKHVQLIFLLECARNGIHAQTEHLSEPFLQKAAEVSQLQFILTGAKAKKTKFQTFHAASLLLLAKSAESNLYGPSSNDAPESLELNSDLLLEKPEYESLESTPEEVASSSKKIKLDDLSHLVNPHEKRLFPISMHQNDIAAELLELDPNNQPTLTDLDNVQLLLRLTILKQTSPVGNAMVEEELGAVVNRIVYSATKGINWGIFGRALWERSVLETNKARTVERGILQMTALVEEVGINIRSTVMPVAEDASEASAVCSRLRFIHQLPMMAQWTMDAKLAQKYMSLGVLKSAIDIYERLQLVTEAALCYAAIDDEALAERLLVARIESHPDDARAISILGDIKQDPALWEKAWNVGRYAKAKASLSKYYYRPPPGSGLSKNLALALEHMHECLRSSPLSYENWFFYGCCGLEAENWELAAEAFTRCVSLDDTNSHAWSNLASALLRTDKTKQAFTALKRALQQGEGANRSWRIYENYLLVAAKLGEWNDVLHATKELIAIRKESGGEVVIDIPVIERLVQILVEEPFSEDARLTHFQKSCIDLVCNILPGVINSSARAWRVVSKVELWRGKPWAALECHEKAYRSTSQRPDLDSSEDVWNEAVESCVDLVSAYESLGEMPGKHGAGDVVCDKWRYKARTSVRSLMSKGKAVWEGSEGWQRLEDLKSDLTN